MRTGGPPDEHPDGTAVQPISAQPRRVLWLLKGLGRGGTERLVSGSLAHIDPARYRVEVAYVLPWKDLLVNDVARHAPVHCLGAGRAGRLAWIPRLRRLVTDRRFDIVHTHMPQPAVVARLILPRKRPVFVHTEHNVWQRYRRITSWSNALTYGRNATALAVSEGVAESIRQPRGLGHSPWPDVQVLIHGIDLATVCTGPTARAEARRRLAIRPDELVVGSVGNFTAKKDHGLLLRAVAGLRSQLSGLRVVLVGSGPLENDLRREADRLGIAEIVTFTGSRGDVPELLPGFDVFALSSRHEGLPIALIEAMAAGLPPVATRVGGVAEIVEDGVSGILVAAGNSGAFAAGLAALLTDPARRAEIGAAAAARAKDFQLTGAVERLQDIYDDVLSAR